MKGFVENDFETMQQARVHLAPLRFGAGIKSKCLLAFKAGTPTVTTAVGAEGLKPSDNWAGSICLDDADFIDSAIKYYQSESEFARAQENCAMILADFNTTNWYPKLEKKLATIAGNLEQHRQANFTGKMLLHHQHLSTRYMSKWIEEKNANITV